MNLIKEGLTKESLSFIRDTIFNTIQYNLKHEHYERVCEVFEKAYAYTTGVGTMKYLKQFRQRESDELKKQREELTCDILPAVINSGDFLLNKVVRNGSITLAYKNTDEAKENNLSIAVNNYYAEESVIEYLKKYQRYYDRSDPNAWLITEFNSTDGTTLAQPYPFIANSKEAINYEFINGILQWLIIETNSKDIKGLTDFTIYTPNQNIKLIVQKEDEFAKRFVNDFDIIEFDGYEYIRLNKRIYKIYIPEPHYIGFVQARRFGCNLDAVTYGETFVPFWWDAECYCTKILNVNSELDITLARHNFPQKIVYSPRCTADGCNKGWLPDNTICGHCNGTGLLPVHTSAQDMIVISLPDNKEEMIDLNTLIAYIYPPIDGLRFTDEKLTSLVKNVKEAIYNSNTYTKDGIETKELGIAVGMEAINDTLYPYGVNYAKSWAFIVKTIARITSTDTNLIITSSVDKDFKLKSKNEIISELNMARLAGANEEVLSTIQKDIMVTMYDEKPTDILRYETKQKYNPFSGKTETEIIALMSSSNVPKQIKVLYSNFGYIFEELERENKNFYDLEENKQIELIRKKVEKISGTLEVEPTLNFD